MTDKLHGFIEKHRDFLSALPLVEEVFGGLGFV